VRTIGSRSKGAVMTDRELMQQALEILQTLDKEGWILADFENDVYKAIEALRARLSQCDRCGEKNPAEIHTCTPIDPLLEALRVPENEFNPDWDAMAVMVEEQQRMAKRVEELTKLVTSQGIRLMDAEAHPEQEPVAWMHKSATGNVYFRKKPQDKVFNPQPVYIAQQLAVSKALVESVRQMRDAQGMDGNWNYDPYMHGLFNGIEFSLSLLEVREPRFRDAPEKWLCDQPKARIFSQGGQHD